MKHLISRRIKLIAFYLAIGTLSTFAQKKPTITILPSDNWCASRFFMTTYDNQGTKVKVPDYQKAFMQDSELGAVISKVGGLLTALKYSVKDTEQELKALNNRVAEDNVTMGKESGSMLAESPLDMLKKRTKSDILIQLWWKVNKSNGGKSVSFTLEAFDSYTSKRIATSTGTGAASNDIVPVLLENAIKNNIKDFDKQLTRFYSDASKNGREIIINIKRWDSWENDLETDFDGESLQDIIEEWLHKNTVHDSFNVSDATENFMQIEQVRIPLLNEKGRALDARGFVQNLKTFLKKDYNIPSKLMTRGLGEAILVLGDQ